VPRLTRAVNRLLAAVALSISTALLSAAPALADGTNPLYPGSVLHVSVTGSLIAGKLLTITATGTNAPDSQGVPIDYGLNLILVDPSKLPGPCFPSFNTELTEITDNPDAGRLLTFETLNEGLSGPFTIPLYFTPAGSGSLLVCAYSMFVTDDAAYASTQVRIAPPPGPGARRPVNTRRPRLTRSGNRLSCTRGSWSGRPTTYSYRWLVGGKANRPSRTATLAVSAKVRGRTVQCFVTATNSAGSATAASRPVAVH
jgi:hypothetical protein